MLPTPSLSHLSKEDFARVYEPAEDTFILLDALEADAERLRREKPRLVVEIGSGSGCVSAFVAAILGDSEAAYLCTDINPHAAICTSKTGEANAARLEPVLTNLLSSLLPRIQGGRSIASTAIPSTDIADREEGKCEDKAGPSGLVDLLLFNPPYVPTSEEEEALAQQDRSLSGSWAGGSLGTRLLHSLIDDAGRSVTSPEAASDQQEEEDEGGICPSEGETDTASPRRRWRRRGGGIESILSPQGHFYCVAIRQNDPQDIVRRLEARGLAAQVVLDRKAGREHLFIIRGSKTKC